VNRDELRAEYNCTNSLTECNEQLYQDMI